MSTSIFRNFIIRSWTYEIFGSLIPILTGIACTLYFRSPVGVYFALVFFGSALFKYVFRRSLKKRGCGKGTLAEANAETYLFRGEDGSELRVPKDSKWLFLERENGNVKALFYSPAYDFVPEEGATIPAPDIKTQRPRHRFLTLIIITLVFIAEIILVTWLFADLLPFEPKVIYRDSCTCLSRENSSVMPPEHTEDSAVCF